MRNFFRLFFIGAKINPGNIFYLSMLIFGPVVGIGNENMKPLTGAIFGLSAVVVTLLPLYIYTSYRVGEENDPQEGVEE